MPHYFFLLILSFALESAQNLTLSVKAECTDRRSCTIEEDAFKMKWVGENWRRTFDKRRRMPPQPRQRWGCKVIGSPSTDGTIFKNGCRNLRSQCTYNSSCFGGDCCHSAIDPLNLTLWYSCQIAQDTQKAFDFGARNTARSHINHFPHLEHLML